jgi:hypothetical protein
MAFLIASPLCCCAKAALDTPENSQCCATKLTGHSESRDRGDEQPQACACKSQEPRDAAKFAKAQPDPALPQIPTTENFNFVPRQIESSSLIFPPHTGCDPPRALLARYSRWLI